MSKASKRNISRKYRLKRKTLKRRYSTKKQYRVRRTKQLGGMSFNEARKAHDMMSGLFSYGTSTVRNVANAGIAAGNEALQKIIRADDEKTHVKYREVFDKTKNLEYDGHNVRTIIIHIPNNENKNATFKWYNRDFYSKIYDENTTPEGMCYLRDITSVKLYELNASDVHARVNDKNELMYPLEIKYTKNEKVFKLTKFLSNTNQFTIEHKQMFLWDTDIKKLQTLMDTLRPLLNSSIEVSHIKSPSAPVSTSTSVPVSTSPTIPVSTLSTSAPTIPVSTLSTSAPSPSTLNSSTSAPLVRNTPPITLHRKEYIEFENTINRLNKQINDINDEIKIITDNIAENWHEDEDAEGAKNYYTHKSEKDEKGEFIVYWEDDFPLIKKRTKLYTKKKEIETELDNLKPLFEEKQKEYTNALKNTPSGKFVEFLSRFGFINSDLSVEIPLFLAEKTENIQDSAMLYLINKLNTKYPRIFNVIFKFNNQLKSTQTLSKNDCEKLASELRFTDKTFKKDANNLNDFVSILYPKFSDFSPDPRIIVFKSLLSLFITINTEYPDLLQILINFYEGKYGSSISLNTDEIKKMLPQPKPQQTSQPTPQPTPQQTPAKSGSLHSLFNKTVGAVGAVVDTGIKKLRSEMKEVLNDILNDILNSLSRLNTKYPRFFRNIINFNQLDQNDKGIISHETFIQFVHTTFILPKIPNISLDDFTNYINHYKYLKKMVDIEGGGQVEKNVDIDFRMFIILLNEIPSWIEDVEQYVNIKKLMQKHKITRNKATRLLDTYKGNIVQALIHPLTIDNYDSDD
jgi:hypothetical protein